MNISSRNMRIPFTIKPKNPKDRKSVAGAAAWNFILNGSSYPPVVTGEKMTKKERKPKKESKDAKIARLERELAAVETALRTESFFTLFEKFQTNAQKIIGLREENAKLLAISMTKDATIEKMLELAFINSGSGSLERWKPRSDE